MSMYSNRIGWYELFNPEKFLIPVDEHMKSYHRGQVKYKSSLELTGFQYCDANPRVKRWSLEPWPIQYVKPTDGKVHRYYVDLYLEFSTDDKFIVEIKSSSETLPPKHPKKQTPKTVKSYATACKTYAINSAKWRAAEKFAAEHGMQFIILTEKELHLRKRG